MPRIFDNIENPLLKALQDTLEVSFKSDFCVGYFNLRGWKQLDRFIEKWDGGEGKSCRLLIGMSSLPQEELRKIYSFNQVDEIIDNPTIVKIKRKLAEEFKEQLVLGFPTNDDEAGLRRLSEQLKSKKVVVKLFIKHSLHAKLYLLYRDDKINPIIGYLGSSNLTLSGLSQQGELNIDVLDSDSTIKLSRWFEDRWNNRYCIDISNELAEIIDNSWAREKEISPYYIYLKMAYYLSQEARAGQTEFKIPKDFGRKLLDFQVKAVQIAAHHLHKRGGVMIGDVVGLGKTLMATALARIFEDDFDLETLILCPKNLVSMWEKYKDLYRMRARVLSISKAKNDLPGLRRFRIVLIDESHNLRNREGKRYRAIHEYLQQNDCKVILLTATPYNKTYLDLANQLRLFIPDDKPLGIRPERLLREIGELDFIRQHQCSIHSLSAFEKSIYPEDWRDLMRLYLVRRTRSFIKENYAKTDTKTGRKYIEFEDRTTSYFPDRIPKNVLFETERKGDQYSRLYSQTVTDKINELILPRYGLGNYIASQPQKEPTQTESKIIADLSRAGKRLMGFSRISLFKRLESSGASFLKSLNRHILRNFTYIYALENNLPVPIGPQDVEILDSDYSDEEDDVAQNILFEDEEDETSGKNDNEIDLQYFDEKSCKQKAEFLYNIFSTKFRKRFRWLNSFHFIPSFKKNLLKDARNLLEILSANSQWEPAEDSKLKSLISLCKEKHKENKILIFTQFADTAKYLEENLKNAGIEKIASVTGNSENPVAFAWRFSPISNEMDDKRIFENELRILIATDVLSEGQNLQDCSIIVNYDLPWAIIKLIQRAGRIDRIGQKAEDIICYSFMPAEGIEKILNLRSRVVHRLKQNAEVLGTDELFFEDESHKDSKWKDLYNEKAGILDGEEEDEVDLGSYAYQIWKNATDKNPKLKNIIPEISPVSYSSKSIAGNSKLAEGVLVYTKTSDENDMLTWVDKNGKIATQSQLAILKAAECKSETPALPRNEKHHELVKVGIEHILEEEKSVGGQLGNRMGARFRVYERLMAYAARIKDTLFDAPDLHKAIDEIYRYPLREASKDIINRQLKTGISNEDLAELIISLHEDGQLCIISEDEFKKEPQIICSMGLFK